MKNIFILFLICTFLSSHSQNKSKCNLTFNKELGIKVYTHVDSAGGAVDEGVLFEFLNSDNTHFNHITKKYPVSQMVSIAYMIELDGKVSLIKVLSPKNDKEIEENAKRILSSLPPHKPCKCGNTFVECDARLNLPLYNKKDKTN